MKKILSLLLIISSFANAQNKITLTLGGSGSAYTDANARAAISLTTTGTSGAATYSSTTGVLNVPQYAGSQTLQQTLDNGSALTSSETIDAGTNQLIVTGTASAASFKVTNTGGGIGKGVDFQSNGSYTLLSANTNGIAPAYLTVGNATTNTALDAIITDRGSTGTAANGIASRYTNYLEADDGSGVVASRFITTLTNAAIGSYTSRFQIEGAASASPYTLSFPQITSDVVGRLTGTTASAATITPTGDAILNTYTVTALATNPTFAAPSGTASDQNEIRLRITDNGTSRTLTWNAIYDEGSDIALPTATVVNETMYLLFVYNSATSKWQLIGKTGGF